MIVALSACGHRDVEIKVAIPGPDSVEAPVAHLPLIALPYDRDSVIAALEARAPSPRPNTGPLDSLFRSFRIPFAAYAKVAYRVENLRDSLTRTKAQLDSLPRGAPEYHELYLRFGQRSESLATLQQVQERAHADLQAARDRLAPRIDSLKAAVRRWEDSSYRPYDSLVSGLAKARGLEPVADTTGPGGRVRVRLPPGRWWIYARSWDATDPNAEWYWNVPVTTDSVVLDARTGRRRPRY